LKVATLGPLGAFAFDADGLGEVASAAGDGEAGADVLDGVAGAVGVAEPLSASAEQPASAAAPAPGQGKQSSGS